MYRRSPYEHDDGSWIAWLSITVVAIMAILFYIVSVLATHLLLYYLNRDLLDGKLDEDDNLVLLWSAIIWAVVGTLAFFPVLLVEGLPGSEYGLEILVGLLSQAIAGGGYGLLVGFGLVWWLWYWQVDRLTTGLEPAGRLLLAPAEVLEVNQSMAISANGSGNGPVPVGVEWYREGVVLGEEF